MFCSVCEVGNNARNAYGSDDNPRCGRVYGVELYLRYQHKYLGIEPMVQPEADTLPALEVQRGRAGRAVLCDNAFR